MTDRPEDALAHAAGALRRLAPAAFRVDLLGASCGIEAEIVDSATPVHFEAAGAVPVAIAEDLLAMKLLAARPGRARDWGDALGLLQTNPDLDLDLVRERLGLIAARGYSRNQDLPSKLDALLSERGGG
jgi:hypothetical protein